MGMSVYRHATSDWREILIEDGNGGRVFVKITDQRASGYHSITLPAEERRAAAQALAGDEWQVVPKAGALPPLYLLDDLWQAVGADISDFDDWHTRHGAANTWGQLLAIVRQAFRPVCGKPVDGEHCVLTAPRSEADMHICHGPSDVGKDELPPLPHAKLPPEQPDRPEPVGPTSVLRATEPPAPKMLREAANILETAPYQRAGTAAWLRDVADILRPEPDEAAVEALYEALRDVYPKAVWDLREAANTLAKRNVRVVSE